MCGELGVSLFGVRERRLGIPLASFLPWISSIFSINIMKLCTCFGSAPHPHIIYHLASVLKRVQCLHMSSRIILCSPLHRDKRPYCGNVQSLRWSISMSPSLSVHHHCQFNRPSITILNLVLLGGWLLLNEVVSWVILEVEGVACYVLVNGHG